MDAVPEERNEAQLIALYAEFAEEDRALAEAGMVGYAEGLARLEEPHPGPLLRKEREPE